RLVAAGAAVAATCWLLAGSPRLLVLALLSAGVVVGGTRLGRSRLRERSALHTRARVVELCDGLQAELASGQTPAHALGRAGTEWPLVAPAARTAQAGGDVPAALRELAVQPGAGELRVVAAAWQVAHRTGHGLADALGRVADDLRAAEQTRRVVSGELASARATARLLAGLPVVALLMGSGAGADPWRFLLGHPVGLACLAAGLACGYAGLAWIETLARDVEGGRR
uniref:type II secretion system F family protein n=1 Tax=Nocardioides sp. SYSU DS0651 TaxID=3415955 RepID=UPI003F4C38B2